MGFNWVYIPQACCPGVIFKIWNTQCVPHVLTWKNKRTNGPVKLNAHLRHEIYILINLFDYNGNTHVYKPRAGSE